MYLEIKLTFMKLLGEVSPKEIFPFAAGLEAILYHGFSGIATKYAGYYKGFFSILESHIWKFSYP